MKHSKQYYGGFWLRFVAAFIDGLIFLAVGAVVNMSFGRPAIALTPQEGPQSIYPTLITLVLSFVYYCVFQAKYSGTLGKKACGLMLVDAKNYAPISIPQAMGRYFMYIVSSIFFCIGLVVAGVTKRKQGWHDMAAGTVVIKHKHLKELKAQRGIFPKTPAKAPAQAA